MIDVPINKGAEGNYSAVIQQHGEWWIGWVVEVSGVNSQGATREELLENLRDALDEALEINCDTRRDNTLSVVRVVSDDDELERLMLAHSPKFQALLATSRRQIEKTGGIPHEQFWEEVEAEDRDDAGQNKPVPRRIKRAI